MFQHPGEIDLDWFYDNPPFWEKCFMFICYNILPCFFKFYTNNILAVYTAFLIGSNQGQQLFIKRLIRKSVSRQSTEYKTLLNHLQQLKYCKTQFDSVMSIFPMLVMSYMFVGITCYVLLMRSLSRQDFMESLFSDGIGFGVNFASIIILVFVVEYYNMKTRSYAAMATTYLTNIDVSESNYKFALINELDQMANFEYTIWSMTKLNRAFILSFSSSLITFAVMIVQLTT
ncbi:hypothetical protein HDE_09371 [Halotydeus destructor]|nr:hypothetical protein HDE_09371 [Halotydeus destructor]